MTDINRYDGRMPYRKCGRWGLKLPALTLGCWHNFGGDQPTENQRAMIHTSFDAGITHFDLANNYGPPPGSAEVNVGKLLRDLPRDEIIVSSKAGYLMWPGPYGEFGSRKYLLASLDQSLKRLGMDYVDIFYSHRFDSQTPLEETMGALETAVRQGKALYTGISSYTSDQTVAAIQTCTARNFQPLVIHQPNYSLLNRWIEKRLLNVTGEHGLGVIAFCPLYQGLLTDKYLQGIPAGSRATVQGSLLREGDLRPEVIEAVHQLAKIASTRGQTLAQMSLSWVLRDERVTTALIGASSPRQIIENVACVKNLSFTGEELQRIDALTRSVELPTSPWAGE
ncbi:MAG: L-glyceraldehyde 3-phosphate reductase [Planctomyces sp.]|nr:L-glyceraldehyde 3-phosphate reductase [Planctomyces sp.]